MLLKDNPRKIFEEALSLEKNGKLAEALEEIRKAMDYYYKKAFENYDENTFEKAKICNENYIRIYWQLSKVEIKAIINFIKNIIEDSFKKDAHITLEYIKDFCDKIRSKENITDEFKHLISLRGANKEVRDFIHDLFNLSTKPAKHELKKVKDWFDYAKNFEDKVKSSMDLLLYEQEELVKNSMYLYGTVYEIEFRYILELIIRLHSYLILKNPIQKDELEKKYIRDLLNTAKKILNNNCLNEIFINKALIRHVDAHRKYKILKNQHGLTMIKLNMDTPDEVTINIFEFIIEIFNIIVKIGLLVSYLACFYEKEKHDVIIWKICSIYYQLFEAFIIKINRD